MATRSIVTYQPDVECDVCGRRLLRGERPDVFIGAGRKHTVCELCVPRATGEGWLRESEAQALSLGTTRPRGARSLLDRLRQLRAPAPEPEEEPEARRAGRREPRRAAQPRAGARRPRRRPLTGRETAGEDADRGYEDEYEQLAGDAGRQAYEGAQDASYDGAYEDSYQGGYEDSWEGGYEDAYDGAEAEEPRTAEHLQLGAEGDGAPAQAGPAHVDLDRAIAQGAPSQRGAEQAQPAAPAAAGGAIQPQGDADGHARRALSIFNSSRFAERVAGIARALGEPEVTLRPVREKAGVFAVVIAWELCWYRYEIDLGDEMVGPQLAAEGMELHELPPEDRACNAAADERGELSLVV